LGTAVAGLFVSNFEFGFWDLFEIWCFGAWIFLDFYETGNFLNIR
jgi:hypothetical protein